MPYVYDVVAWEDDSGDRHGGPPDDLDDTFGCLVHVYDPEDPEDENYFWAFIGDAFENWLEWEVYIETLIEIGQS